MKGVGGVIIVVMVIVIAILGFYNFKQAATINLLNEEIFEQARRRHDLILENHVLETQIERLESDSVFIN